MEHEPERVTRRGSEALRRADTANGESGATEDSPTVDPSDRDDPDEDEEDA